MLCANVLRAQYYREPCVRKAQTLRHNRRQQETVAQQAANAAFTEPDFGERVMKQPTNQGTARQQLMAAALLIIDGSWWLQAR
ncbi:hypothetical protein [Paraburkholderia aspalathi]|uniref:Uncharacterized protein n=1 Tax=Paraburkholderia aspalathi TaxID=1324617 RepID=A0A1I7EJ48_9BURK|nr:hypothetical protein [Paraburkholderia aspalathi]SFU23963.1 hypothetical protein SAMN05192563_102433 [Paraburkholderia aspalathi]